MGGVNLSGDLNLSGTAHTNAGTYNGDAWSFTDPAGNYQSASGTVTDVINKAALTITADNETKVSGATLTLAGTAFTASGLLGSDAVSSVTLASAGTVATAAVGTYPITASNAVGTGLGNYTISYDSGTLTVTGSSWTSSGTIYVLDQSAGSALSLSGSAGVNVTGDVIVDSSSSSAIAISGAASVKAAAIQVVGGVQKSGSPTLSPQPVTGSHLVSDPLAALPYPAIPSGQTNYGSKSIAGSSSATLQPGIYSQISVSGAASVTLAAGTYVIQGGGLTASGSGTVSIGAGTSIILEGGGLSVSGAAAVTGTGVTVFNFGTAYNGTTDGGTFGPITLSGSGSVRLTPPASGTYAGILIFQGRDNAKALTFSGAAMQGVTGMIYAPAAQLAESGSAQVGSASSPISMVVDTMTLSGAAIANSLSLSASEGTVAYTPAQIRDAYGINALAQDGTGQTIAIVDAYDDPSIDQAVDAFDSQFSLTDSGPSLYAQNGPAASFLTVLNQFGQPDSLPSTDPAGPGAANWELEEALDVEWTHAIAPGAQIILVEANSQSLSDLMASVATAASQPGVSVVSMSWGFAEGQAVLAADEALYDQVFSVPGVTFVASTGDYGAADPEYPAFSPDVVAVGGTSLALNADNSYHSETGWGYYSDSAGTAIGSGGGVSLYEPEPAYQQGVQSTGSRTTPDVAMVADPDTGAWVADPYNLNPSDPFEVVGGTSLSAPAWAGLIALANQGRVAAGESTLNSATPTDTQQALYKLPQSDYNVISSGNNGYSAESGYNLVTGLGTPVANLLVPDLVAYQGAGTTYAGPTVAPLQDATLGETGTGDGGPIDVFSVFDALADSGDGWDLSTNQTPAGAGALARTTQDLNPLYASDRAAIAERAAVPVIVPAIADSVAPASVAGSFGMTPLTAGLTATDAALAGWSSSRSGSPKRVVIRTGAARVAVRPTRPSLALGRSRPEVLQGTAVDAALEGWKGPRSQTGMTWPSFRRGGKPRHRPLVDEGDSGRTAGRRSDLLDGMLLELSPESQ